MAALALICCATACWRQHEPRGKSEKEEPKWCSESAREPEIICQTPARYRPQLTSGPDWTRRGGMAALCKRGTRTGKAVLETRIGAWVVQTRMATGLQNRGMM